MKSIMDIQEILKCLPHRYPFLLIDKVVDFKPGQTLTAIKNVTINEAFFTGHFPEYPVMPGVLILEALAQAGVILASQSTSANGGADKEALYYFAAVDNAKFRRKVGPGDQLRLEVKILGSKLDFWKLSGKAYVEENGELACSAEFLSARK